MSSNNDFLEFKGIGDVARKLVETKKDIVYQLVFSFLKLVLILPVATATVERVFSVIMYVNNRLRNRMGDRWMNDYLITYIERYVVFSVENEAIMQRFLHMKTC